MKAFIKGKIESVNSTDDAFFAVIVCAAPSEFEQPPVLEVKSERKIGKVGEVVELEVTLAGYRERPWTNNAGEKVRRIRNLLIAA